MGSRQSRSRGHVFTQETGFGFGAAPSEDGESASSYNLGRLFTIGLLFNKGQQANELFGAYTGNRLRQKRIETGMTFAKYGIGIAINPVIGGAYAIGDLAYRGISYGVEIGNKNLQANYYARLSGNIPNNGSRYRGSFL